MERVLRLPCNEQWLSGIKSGHIPYDYRHMTPYWSKRLDGREYDVVEFYHRFKKDLEPVRYKFDKILKGTLSYTHEPVYIIMFGNKIF